MGIPALARGLCEHDAHLWSHPPPFSALSGAGFGGSVPEHSLWPNVGPGKDGLRGCWGGGGGVGGGSGGERVGGDDHKCRRLSTEAFPGVAELVFIEFF